MLIYIIKVIKMKLFLLLILSTMILNFFNTQYIPYEANYNDYAKSIARRITIFKRVTTDFINNEEYVENQIINFENVMSNFCNLKKENTNINEIKLENYIKEKDCILSGYNPETLHLARKNEVYAIIKDDILTVFTGEALCEHNLIEQVYQEVKRLNKNPYTLNMDHESDQYSSCGHINFKVSIKP